MIHPTAVVDRGAQLGAGVRIGPFCVVEGDTRLGAGVELATHAVVKAGCDLGEGVRLDSFSVVGGLPQMRQQTVGPEVGRVVIGPRTVLREGVTVHRPTTAEGRTEIGADCFLMAHSHVAHDCLLGAFVTLANNAMLAGHVTVGDHVFVGGGAGVHQFVRIGESAMIGGNAAISYDVPPFTIAADRNDIVGLNLLGIRRRGLPSEVVADLKRCFRAVFHGCGNVRDEAARALAAGAPGDSPSGRQFLLFFGGSRRGFGQARHRRRDEDAGAAAGAG